MVIWLAMLIPIILLFLGFGTIAVIGTFFCFGVFFAYLAGSLYCYNKECSICKKLQLLEAHVLSHIRKGQVVVLIDYADKISYSVAIPIHESDNLLSWFHAATKVGPVILLDDGTVTKTDGSRTFIYNWLPYNPEQRTWKVLQGSRNFTI